MNTIHNFTESIQKYDHTVGVIDTDRLLNDRLSRQLRDAGCTVLQAFSSDEIPPLLIQHPDFIIIDPIYTSCDEFSLCNYLQNEKSAGVIIFTYESHQPQRDFLFECGILEFFTKKDPLEEVTYNLLHLFETVWSNIDYRISIISQSESTTKKINKLISHRNYHFCFSDNPHEIKQSWEHHNHEFPDLLVIDLQEGNLIKETFEFIHYFRVYKLLEIPIVVLLDHDEYNLSSKLYRAGVNDVLVAPYSYEKFLLMITHHLDYRIHKKQLRYEHSLSCQLKAMIESSSIVSKSDAQGVITYVNKAFCTITGYTAQELIGKPHNIVRHPDNSPLLFVTMWKMLQNKQIFHGILKNRRKDGTTYYVDSTIAPVLDDTDTIMEYISIRHDVTPLILKQHEIEEQRRQIQNVLNAQTSLICMVDKEMGIRQSNSNFSEFLGISHLSADIDGCHYLNELFLDAEDAFTVKNGERYVWLDRLYEMRNKFIKVVMKDRVCNHHVFSIHVEKIPDLHFSNGICYLVTLENVTELNRALREAKSASEAESRFLATMSHEIRTPLNGILGFSELLSETSLDTQQLQYLKAITSSGETLRQIINDILDIMKMDREELQLIYEPINIIDELETMIYPFYAQAAKKGVKLLVTIDPKLPLTIETDLLRLKQILINLISNAIKFTSRDKQVYIRVKKLTTLNNEVKIGFTIADEGIGVKPEHKAHIFKAFVQADNSISREFGGTGLGLNIAMRVISAMGAHLSFKSTYGKGSVFYTSLHFTTNPLVQQYQQPKPIRSVTFKNLRILVAEDNEVNQLYIQELLNKLHVEYHLAHDGYEAVRRFINDRYDMVLMDINMPNMDGITAAQQILRYEHDTGASHTPIIGLSADAVATNITKYIQEGLDGYLVKPLQKSDLTKLLKRFFRTNVVYDTSSKIKEEQTLLEDKEIKINFTSSVALKLELPEAIIIELFKEFINNAHAILIQVQENHDDPIQLKMAIHSLKGISKNLFLEELGNKCEHFEKDIDSLSAKLKLQRLEQIRMETEKILQEMQKEIAL